MTHKWTGCVKWLLTIAALLALVVVMLGAFTRLTDAGLGCPDWPGCYGHWVLPNQATLASEHVVVATKKAWTEMIHRYAAGTLVLIILATFILIFSTRSPRPFKKWLPAGLALLIVFQALLGMWTVTLKLLPIVVMGHLIGGILIFSLLTVLAQRYWLVTGLKSGRYLGETNSWYWPARVGVVLIVCQVLLGAWVSANYAGIACIGFPQCNGMWWPGLHFSHGFGLLLPIGDNYQGGILDPATRISIQWIHRLGAMGVFLYTTWLAFFVRARTSTKQNRGLACLLWVLILIQIGLGILNVLYQLPLAIAVAHNGVAACLVAAMMLLADRQRGMHAP